ncbi:probable LRR receptor-like serine/threonine-protein kinase At3g47570 [Olea europaea var. sylvestris]|uniref:probable LRR receptor-like serine/threonine-protein kinase At3g47570 n=1 Tax=Olea europaea var. sylvestris TaxID=158386 RepID=UPI000C1D2ECA|nr:probable LRR receptor-like serine/threonine-protein kinase At3g47570 [Olea europaea var. sylvestris]
MIKNLKIHSNLVSNPTMLKTLKFTAFCFLIFIFPSFLAVQINISDYAALMAFKSKLLVEPDNILSTNWSSRTHFCNWFGITCLNERITGLQLPGLALQGTISSCVANMTQLVALDLSNNKLEGVLPSELGLLQQVKILNTTKNSLQGSIPANLSRCQNLERLDFSYNFVAGSIPVELGLLRNLEYLALDHNNLTGSIPSSLGNFSKLEYLYLEENDLEGDIPGELGNLDSLKLLALRGNSFVGSIPPPIFNILKLQIVDISVIGLSGELPEDLGDRVPNLERLFLDSNRITGKIPVSLSNSSKLTHLFFTENDLRGDIPNEFGGLLNLQWFEFEYNQISGNVPYSLFNISSLEILKTRHNYLSGNLPPDIGKWLPNLQEIFLSHNQFHGEIPSSICNATKLVSLEVANNSFSGQIPQMLGNLVDLEHLNLQVNSLVNNPGSTYLDFLDSLVKCRNLQYLILETNPLNGIIPGSIGNLSSTLKVFTVISCEIKGSIPHELGNLSSLFFLGLSNNGLVGEIPSSLGGLQNLERLYLTGNKLKGTIPAEVCNIKVLGILHLGENKFSGSIPTYIENLTELREVSFADNNFSSTVPIGLWKLVKIGGLNLSKNLLDGSIPTEVGNLKALNIIDLSSNNFSGEIPNSIGFLQMLLSLDMSKNNFRGFIPDTLSNLIVLEFLDLSSNALSGNIPESLESLKDLKFLNISFNRLEGNIPDKGVFKNITYQSLMGNTNLCGGPSLKFPSCPAHSGRSSRKRRLSLVLTITVPIVAVVLLLVICLLVWISFLRKKHSKNSTRTDSPWMGHRIITYNELLRATENFSESNVLGSGSSCMVYKGELSDGTIAAIKVFNLHFAKALKNFDTECEVLSNVRHRNLVKIISTCSNVDFKAMVLEYMSNGSLDKWLYSQNNYSNPVERLDILIDVALAMEYLHHEYMVPIVHCDLKPSNVLLDEDMTARVSDFGIAKILTPNQLAQTETLGTMGYIAPEYGLDGHLSPRVDVYSFGILLLEIFTKKRPTDDMFTGDLNLHQWINRSFPSALAEILDSNLFIDIDFIKEGASAPIIKNQNQIEELLVPTIHVGLLCSKESPDERPDMRDVVVKLKKIRTALTHRK